MTTVLVVDDSQTDLRLAGGVLQKGSGLDVVYATDGRDALDKMSCRLPDLVVTDLQMPRMDGLELVTEVRTRFPQVPVVLMTAHGSEQVAVAALKHGAASYVPKSALAHDLLPTVFNVLAVARADLSYERMMACLSESHMTFTLESDFRLVAPLIQMVRRTMTEMGIGDEAGQVQMSVALEEALLLALYHGNLELTAQQVAGAGYDLFGDEVENVIQQRRMQPPYKDRKLSVEVQFAREDVRFVIRHEGPGLADEPLPSPADILARDDPRHRGSVHMRLFMDEVRLEDSGKTIVLIKRHGTD